MIQYSSAVRFALAIFALTIACRGSQVEPAPVEPDAQASPQANAIPAPLASTPDPTNATASSQLDAGPPPVPMRGDEALTADAPPREVKDAQAPVYTMEVALRPIDPPAPPKGPEIGAAAIEAARKRLDPHIVIDFSPTRVRMQVSSGAWLLVNGWELRARADRYGHVLVAPDQSTYRVLAPGALRALIGERRLDVAPVAAAEIVPKGEGTRRLGMKTRRVDVSSRSAKATFEIARVDGLGEAGPMIGRALLDLMSAPPSTPLVATDELPLHAELKWTTRGGLVYDALTLSKRSDLALASLSVPPAEAAFTSDPLPRQASGSFLTASEIAGLHSAPVDVGPQPLPPGDVHATLTLGNATDELRVAWVDGVPAAWVVPRGRVDLVGLLRGRYQLEWRTFLGDAAEAPFVVTAPGASELGADGGLSGK